MTPLDLAHPLASLLDACRADGRKLSQRDLGEARQPPKAQASVANAIEAGDRIKLSTLASYARAAGYTLYLETWRWICGCDGSPANPRPVKDLVCTACGRHLRHVSSADTDDLDITVAGARALVGALGLEMTLAVEPAERSGG